MVRYARQPENPAKSALARSEYTRTHFKNAREVCHAIRGMKLQKALAYLEAVKEHKRAIPFTRFHRGIGRTAQAKEFKTTQARWPVKTAKFVIQLLKNVESNADAKGLDTDSLVIKHIQANQAPKQRRRTYRAHGRINPYMTSPAHLEVMVVEDTGDAVPKAAENRVVRLNKRQIAQRRLIQSREQAA